MKRALVIIATVLMISYPVMAGTATDNTLRQVASKIHNVQASVVALNTTMKAQTAILERIAGAVEKQSKSNNGNHCGQD